MSDKIVIVTSQKSKPDRFIEGNEWEKAWGFDASCALAFRDKDNREIELVKSISEDVKIKKLKNSDLIWINGSFGEADSRKSKIKTNLSAIVSGTTSGFRIAYHDLFLSSYQDLSPFKNKPYSLTKGNEKQFEAIMKEGKFDTSVPLEYFHKVFFLNLSQSLPILKHRITHLFLPVDIDLQGIKELKEKEDRLEVIESGRSSIDYLAEVLSENAKGDVYYRQKLADLHFIISGKSFATTNSLEREEIASGGFVKPAITANDLLDNKSLCKLIEDRKDKVDIILKALLELSGLLKKGKNITANSDSKIFQFMCLMDCYIREKATITNTDVVTVLSFFEKDGWEITSAIPFTIQSFSDWICALSNYLSKMCKVLSKE